MSKLELSKEKIVEVLESQKPKSLTEVYRLLGGQGKLSGSLAGKIRILVPDIEKVVADNKAGAAQVDGKPEATLRTSKTSKADKKTAKTVAKSKVPRHPKNPFRPGGYATLLDLIAAAGPKGIGREDLLKDYCKATGKDDQHARFDLAVINSARQDSDKRHRSCADDFTILKEGDNYRVRFS